MLPLRKAQGLNKLVQFIAISACLIVPVTGSSQESGTDDVVLEEIIVTARKRAQALSNVPIAISAIGQTKIEDYGYTNLESYFRTIPSVALVDGGAQRKQVIIRGITVDHSVRGESLSSIYVDETLVSGGLFGLDLRIFDMERLEVLKGPQGTLFGGGFFTLGVHMLDLCRWMADAGLQPLQMLTANATHIDSSADYPLNIRMSGILADGTELAASTDLRGDQPAKVEIAIDYDSVDVTDISIRHAVAATDEDFEYDKMIAAFVDAAKTNIADQSYFSEVLVTHRDLIKARNIAK